MESKSLAILVIDENRIRRRAHHRRHQSRRNRHRSGEPQPRRAGEHVPALAGGEEADRHVRRPLRSRFEIFAEHAALSAFENDGSRDFDIGAFAGIDRRSYDRMQPFQWPRSRPGAPAETRFFASGGFYTSDRKARIIAVRAPAPRPVDDAFPLVLNT